MSILSKIATNSAVYFSLVINYEVMRSMTSKLSETLKGPSTDPMEAISMITKVISSHFEPGNPGNPGVRLTFWPILLN